jgi:hypothetical protein
VSRRKPRAEPAKLAKVIPFGRSKEEDLEAVAREHWRLADAAIDAIDADLKRPAFQVTRDRVVELQEAVDRALTSLLAAKAYIERELGERYPICAQNAGFLRTLAARIERCAKARNWCIDEAKRFAPDATVYNLAEFRRFRNRVVNKGATP